MKVQLHVRLSCSDYKNVKRWIQLEWQQPSVKKRKNWDFIAFLLVYVSSPADCDWRQWWKEGSTSDYFNHPFSYNLSLILRLFQALDYRRPEYHVKIKKGTIKINHSNKLAVSFIKSLSFWLIWILGETLIKSERNGWLNSYKKKKTKKHRKKGEKIILSALLMSMALDDDKAMSSGP